MLCMSPKHLKCTKGRMWNLESGMNEGIQRVVISGDTGVDLSKILGEREVGEGQNAVITD